MVGDMTFFFFFFVSLHFYLEMENNQLWLFLWNILFIVHDTKKAYFCEWVVFF